MTNGPHGVDECSESLDELQHEGSNSSARDQGMDRMERVLPLGHSWVSRQSASVHGSLTVKRRIDGQFDVSELSNRLGGVDVLDAWQVLQLARC